MFLWWSQRDGEVRKKTTRAAPTAPRFDPSNPPTNKGNGCALVLVETITFECQKIILPVIFSHVSASAKARNGRGGNRK